MIAWKPHVGNLILGDLSDGLILRKARLADTEELVAFNTFVHFSRKSSACGLFLDKPELRLYIVKWFL